MQIPKLPDPSTNQLWLHITKFHNSNTPDWPHSSMTLERTHAMHHVRGEFISIHFHYSVERFKDAKS